jgi:hypothetical protein
VPISQSGPGAGPHVYWRVLIRASFIIGTATSIQELEFLDVSGTDLANGGTATASTSSGSNTPDKAFDNNQGTFWTSGGIPSGAGAPEWLRYQFASAVAPVAIRMTLNEATRNQAPGDFDVQYSDNGSSWTTVKTFTPSWYVNSAADIIPTLSLPLAAATGYMNWRARVNGTQNGTPTSCASLEMHEAVGGADVTSSVQQHGLYSDWFSGPYYGFTAFDRNASTFWAAANNPPGNWLGNSMGRSVTIVEIAWQARPDSSYTQSPTSVTMQATNDGATWVNLGTATFGTWTSAGQKQTVPVV